MSKLMYLLLGLLLVAGAVSLGGYRHVYEPRTRTARAPESSISTRSVDRSSRVTAPTSRQSAPATPGSGTSLSAWATFDTIVNVLNVVVGVIGIFLALHGMRMHKQAMALHSARVDDRRG